MNVEPNTKSPDREVFHRVWQRVMPQTPNHCPIVPSAEAAGAPPPVPNALPAPRECPSPGCIPPVPLCLSESSREEGPRLLDLHARKLHAHRRYLSLAKRASGRSGTVLTALANDERRHMKRLSAAYFLIFGEELRPATGDAPAGPTPLRNALRTCFLEEQNTRARAYEAATATADLCLRDLYLDFLGDDAVHAQLLRGVLEEL